MRAFLAVFFSARLAFAECQCAVDGSGDCIASVSCDADTFNGLTHSLQDTEHALSIAMAANKRLEADLTAAIEAQQPSVLPYVLTAASLGFLAGFALAYSSR